MEYNKERNWYDLDLVRDHLGEHERVSECEIDPMFFAQSLAAKWKSANILFSFFYISIMFRKHSSKISYNFMSLF